MNQPTEKPPSKLPMPAGGHVIAIIPQSIEEVFRVANGVVKSGIAPYALVGKVKSAEDFSRACSAVAIVIMAGAELGLPPMVALRSFTVINGRPALYGDGLINVVRRSKQAKLLKVGMTLGGDWRLFIRAGRLPEPEGDTPEEIAEERERIKAMFDALPEDERTGGYCEATRADTGESKATVFTVAEAKRAGLWQTEAEVLKDVWENGNKIRKMMPNDSPWFRYPQRMLGWRAAGFNLRDLFGDVLGGITDDWEAREIGGMIDITPDTSAPASEPENDGPPKAPPLHKPDQPEGEKNEVVTGEVDESGETAENSPTTSPSPAFVLDALALALAEAVSEEEIEAAFDEADVQTHLTDEKDLERAFEIKREHIYRVARNPQKDEGLFDETDAELPEETKAAVRNLGTP